MSLPAISSTPAGTLPTANIHPHGHGHKKGLDLDSLTDPSSTSASQTPTGSTQSVFGRLFNSLVEAIGAKPVLSALTAPAIAAATPSQAVAPPVGSNVNTKA
jgi:hypothetical protein